MRFKQLVVLCVGIYNGSSESAEWPAYPARNASEELLELKLVTPSHLHEIVHYVYAGNVSQLRKVGSSGEKRAFQVLVVGAGTGDSTIMLGVQLHQMRVPFHIHHLEPSAEANKIAAERAKVRGLLPFVTFVQATLDKVAIAEGHFKFDYIDCGMVLQQLPSPAQALSHLNSLLVSNGGMGLSITAHHNRGYSDLQQLLRLLAEEEGKSLDNVEGSSQHSDRSDPLDMLREVLQSLPPRHPFRSLRSREDLEPPIER
jgi:SAM-dependent methyltransferase